MPYECWRWNNIWRYIWRITFTPLTKTTEYLTIEKLMITEKNIQIFKDNNKLVKKALYILKIL